MAVPGASRRALGPRDVDEFLAGLDQRSAGRAGPLPPNFAEFEAIYQNRRPHRPLGEFMPGAAPGLTPFLHVRPGLQTLNNICFIKLQAAMPSSSAEHNTTLPGLRRRSWPAQRCRGCSSRCRLRRCS